MRAVTGDMSAGWDYLRLKEKQRRESMWTVLLCMLVLAVIFGVGGFYIVWLTFNPNPAIIVGGAGLMLCSAICLFIGACAGVDLLPE